MERFTILTRKIDPFRRGEEEERMVKLLGLAQGAEWQAGKGRMGKLVAIRR